MLKKILLPACVLVQTVFLMGMSQGEMLERQMWEDIKTQNWDGIENHIASSFQSIHQDGARGKAEEMTLIKKLAIGDYSITDMKVTECEDAIIVTYMIAVPETIDKQRLSINPAPRMSVWQNNSGVWQWIAHANLNPIPNTIPTR
jgi:hypothetical protein